MSVKDYGGWHVEKLRLNALSMVPHCYEREIWWAAIGCNIGFEEDGKGESFARPILILRKYNFQFILAIPLSTTKRTGVYYHNFTQRDHSNTALLSQIRAIDTRRLLKPFGRASDQDFQAIRTKLKNML